MSSVLNPNGGLYPNLNQIEQSQVQQVQAPHQPGLFRRILGGVAGMAGNAFAPGFGGALGSIIGGGGSAFSSNLAASGFASNASNFAAANQLLAVAKQSNEDEEATELASNLEKSRHETFMAVIQNIT